jgi:hypothetical protein
MELKIVTVEEEYEIVELKGIDSPIYKRYTGGLFEHYIDGDWYGVSNRHEKELQRLYVIAGGLRK